MNMFWIVSFALLMIFSSTPFLVALLLNFLAVPPVVFFVSLNLDGIGVEQIELGVLLKLPYRKVIGISLKPVKNDILGMPIHILIGDRLIVVFPPPLLLPDQLTEDFPGPLHNVAVAGL
jgi:hypothetical protein